MATPEVIIPVNENGNRMSPYEAATGVVLSLWAPGTSGKINRHHAHFYKDDYEKGPRDMRGFLRPVRFSRLQQISRGAHAKHHREFEGTQYPEDRHAAFRITILNMSGYISPFVIDMSQRTTIKETTPAMRETLRQPGILTFESSKRRCREIGSFLMYYSIQQKFTPDDIRLVEEFISIPTPETGLNNRQRERRSTLGLQLVDIALAHAVDPIEPYFREAHAAQSLREGAPATAFEVVKGFVQGHEQDYYSALRGALDERYTQAA